jgi:hypothetical protein
MIGVAFEFPLPAVRGGIGIDFELECVLCSERLMEEEAQNTKQSGDTETSQHLLPYPRLEESRV